MTKQTVKCSIVNNQESAMEIYHGLIYEGFSVTLKCAGEVWIVKAERELEDGEEDIMTDPQQAGHTIN